VGQSIFTQIKQRKMALSTTDLGKEGGGLPKTFAPGNHTLKINSVYLEDFKFIPDAVHFMMNMETEPIEGFEGFMIDKDDESKGHYAGQIGRVKASQYAFADGETKSGIKIQRDRSIMMFLQNLCKSIGINDWFLAQDNKYDTIEQLVNAFATEAPFKDKYLEFCIAGKEYEGKTGYTNYDMWLPKGSKDGYAYASKGAKVMPYNEATHLKKLEVKPVNGFGNDDLDIPMKSSTDFSLD
jgi:hypothetical protein